MEIPLKDYYSETMKKNWWNSWKTAKDNGQKYDSNRRNNNNPLFKGKVSPLLDELLLLSNKDVDIDGLNVKKVKS